MTDVEITTKLEPRIVTVKRFRCRFCSFSRATKRLVVEHMDRCWSDPAKRTCRTCTHFERGYAVARFDPYEPPEALDVEDECAVGEELPETAPVVGCPLWQSREVEEAVRCLSSTCPTLA